MLMSGSTNAYRCRNQLRTGLRISSESAFGTTIDCTAPSIVPACPIEHGLRTLPTSHTVSYVGPNVPDTNPYVKRLEALASNVLASVVWHAETGAAQARSANPR